MAEDNALVSGGRLRADLAEQAVEIVPGVPGQLTVRVTNASSVIEMATVRLVGLQPESLLITPSSLRLFPEESVEVVLDFVLPRSFAAGTHQVTVLIAGVSAHVAPAEVTAVIIVAEESRATLSAEPPVRTGGAKTTFVLEVENTGNGPLTAQLRAADADRLLTLELDRPIRELQPGTSEVVEMVARGKRPWFGSAAERVITVVLEAGPVTDTADVRFRQRPRISAGVITLLTLALVGLLWALAMLFGVSAALSPAAPTKELPVSFTTGGIGIEDLDPAVVGGSVTGVVTAGSTAQPVARTTVEAFDRAGRLVGATATDDEGVFLLDALLPTRYRIRFRAPGFTESWWPDAPDADSAALVGVSPAEPTEGIDATLSGLPGSLGGQAIAGDGAQQPVTVDLTPVDVTENPVTLTTVTDGEGVWSIGGLTAPATYRVVYRSEGYAPVEVTQPLEAGQTAQLNTVRLPAAEGAIAGLVVDRDGTPLGGIEIEAQRGDEVIATTTPTAGEIGSFRLVDLQTPATYLLTFTGEGRASETRAVRLGPGESLEGLVVELPADTGAITGRVTDASGAPLGGVTVTVTGGDTQLAAETLTSGQVGRFRIDRVPVPGTYAVTFEIEGRESETVQTTLQLDDPTADLNVQLASALGRISGKVVDSSNSAVAGAVIEVSGGGASRTTTTASEPDSQRGAFVLEDLEPGSYTVTARAPNGASRTVLIEIVAGQTTKVTLKFGGGS